MRVALPSTNRDERSAPVATHFGRTAVFTVINTETDEIELLEHEGGHGHDSSPPPVTIANANVDVVIAGDIGRGAVSRLQDAGIEVFRGADGTVDEALTQWEAGELEAVDPGDVHGHDHGDHDHDHGDHEHGHGHGDHEHGHGHGDHEHGHGHGDHEHGHEHESDEHEHNHGLHHGHGQGTDSDEN
ncbi:NifB/NifX family molybdenum-iron cluster-binding protein [Halodesulfurarchaeum formicicum]|uniref:Dinitrogenase iron-molybdenum cofactor biosynthesis protein n=1 Tax=Halodesulfurarchaeum formicicum TaxID=1873524 RepID=A0A1J1ADD4_9EURY|nr:NifB/NifX family molybdenum-iron cluster-binding protein [Halodesulfurarchaeum formicicum]APE96170.1 dinitrogenase iron-molybdenum cofactor biosynthesis protein [Halodesulfurarchaeum formicicum]